MITNLMLYSMITVGITQLCAFAMAMDSTAKLLVNPVFSVQVDMHWSTPFTDAFQWALSLEAGSEAIWTGNFTKLVILWATIIQIQLLTYLFITHDTKMAIVPVMMTLFVLHIKNAPQVENA